MNRLSLKMQLLLSMVLLIAVPLMLMTGFGNYYYARGVEEQANEFSSQMLDQVRMNIDAAVSAVDRVIEYLARDPDLIEYLRLEGFYSPGRAHLETVVRSRMRIYAEGAPELIGGLLVAGANGLYASNELYRVTRNPLPEDEWYRRAMEAGGTRVLLSQPIGRNIRNFRNYSSSDIVAVVCAVNDPDTGEALGVIAADMFTAAIEERIQDVTLGKSGYVFVQDAANEIVYAPVNESVYRIRGEWLRQESPGIHSVGGVRYQLFYTHSDITDWGTVGVFLPDEPMQLIASQRRSMFAVAAVAIALATMLALSFSAAFTDPISKLRRLMGEAERGNLDVSFDTGAYSGEIRQLGTSFNSMMDQIRQLIDLVYREQRAKREAEIRVLQAQIKPHFLYNTLDTIRWMAEEHDAPEIGRMVGALTKLFRVSLSRGREVIPLANEMDHVCSYLYIQKVRYEDKLNYEIDVPAELLSLQVNKLILQPLVENAIYHGIKQKRGEGHIRLSARHEGERLIFEVADDGAGMSPEKCAQINEELRAAAGTEYDHGYGLFNVNSRIRLSYGAEYGLHYRVNETGGITVTLTCPAISQVG